MAPGLDLEGGTPSTIGRQVALDGELGKAAATSSRASAAAAAIALGGGACERHQLGEAFELQGQALSAAVAMRRSSSPSSTVVKRVALAMVWRWMKPADLVSFSRWIAVDLDVIAQHIVVADLEGGDAGLPAIALLQLEHQAPALVARLRSSSSPSR